MYVVAIDPPLQRECLLGRTHRRAAVFLIGRGGGWVDWEVDQIVNRTDSICPGRAYMGVVGVLALSAPPAHP